MEPTKKTKDLETFLEDGFGRNTAIENNNCVFCKTPVTDFRDEISIREYRISGMCQACQDEVFRTE